MNYTALLREALTLSPEDQAKLINDLSKVTVKTDYISSRRAQLLNKQIGCPHCGSMKHYRFGKDKGSQRYKCNTCKKTFTEYTGTWVAGLHKKEYINEYIELMNQGLSLDKIKKALKINKKTAFDWRHKILSSYRDTDNENFAGITESDETFFLESEKGKQQKKRTPRKRGGKSSKRGISDDQVAVIVTSDRKGTMDMTVSTMGRITKKNIKDAIGSRLSKDTILCSDSHVSYKGFAIDLKLKHIALRSDLKQRVKDDIFHIQHVNSIHSRVKKWIDSTFQGVSTKYLQNYLNWFKVQENHKNSIAALNEMIERSLKDCNALIKFRKIDCYYTKLITTQ